MNMKDALNILGVTGENITLEQCKLAYRKACAKYHPDRNPGGTEMMKAVNLAWAHLQSLDWTRPVNNAEGSDAGYGDSLMAFINSLVGIPGLTLEVCGAWVWISGDTRPHKDAIKAAGGMWASKKLMWYFRPKEYRSRGARGDWSMDAIRETYGSATVKQKERDAIPA